jgi:hypothetical protein
MRPGWLVRCLSCAVFPLVLCAGCQTLTGRRPVSIQVLDADNKQPIFEARTQITYPLAEDFLPSGSSVGRTGQNGIAQLTASANGDTQILLEVAAEGYLPEHRFVPVETVRAIKPAGLFELLERRPANLVVEMYAERPLPTLDLVLPAGYRGVVQVDLQIAEDASGLPGQRQFSFTVPPSGSIQVTGPAVLAKFPVPNVTARFADGAPLSREPKAEDWEIGFWPVKYESRRLLFLVGTKAELARYRAEHPEEAGLVVRARGSSKGGGKGRGRRSAVEPDSGP